MKNNLSKSDHNIISKIFYGFYLHTFTFLVIFLILSDLTYGFLSKTFTLPSPYLHLFLQNQLFLTQKAAFLRQ